MQEYEGSSLTDIAAAPTSALQGVAQKGREVLKLLGQHILTAFFARKLLPVVRCWFLCPRGNSKFRLSVASTAQNFLVSTCLHNLDQCCFWTIFLTRAPGDLGNWKFYRIAKAILGLSQLEQEGKREEGAALNINKACTSDSDRTSPTVGGLGGIGSIGASLSWNLRLWIRNMSLGCLGLAPFVEMIWNDVYWRCRLLKLKCWKIRRIIDLGFCRLESSWLIWLESSS